LDGNNDCDSVEKQQPKQELMPEDKGNSENDEDVEIYEDNDRPDDAEDEDIEEDNASEGEDGENISTSDTIDHNIRGETEEG